MLRKKLTALALGAAAAGLGATGLSMAGGVAGATTAPRTALGLCGTKATGPTIKHVVLVMEENQPYGSIIGSSSAPYINSLARACGLATNFHNITHPSLPEYIALTSATDFSQLGKFETDCDPAPGCNTGSQSIFSQVHGTGWKAYNETMATACDKTSSGLYGAKHNPAVYYTDIPAATCKADDLSLGTLASSPFLNAFKSETTAPKFTVVTPNLNDDMHNGTVAQGDTWLKNWMTKFLATSVYKSGDTAVFIIWDEGEGGSFSINEKCYNNTSDPSCHVAALVVAPSVKTGTKVTTFYNHYAFVHTAEQLLGLALLNDAAKAPSMVKAFNL